MRRSLTFLLVGVLVLAWVSPAWATGLPIDFDNDGDVDQSDFGPFQVCLSGQGTPPADPDCFAADLDGDGDVDGNDTAFFAYCSSGPNTPADVNCAGRVFTVTPTDDLIISGEQGGPFIPLTTTCTLTHAGDIALEWEATWNEHTWLNVSPAQGTLAIGANEIVTLSVAGGAAGLPPNTYPDTITFINRTTGVVNGSRSASLVVNERTGNCRTAWYGWQNEPFPIRNGVFTAEFDAVPNDATVDGLTGISLAQATSPADCAAMVRFNIAGQIDARNGDAYQADSPLSYASGANYHFRLVINVLTHTYTIYITPEGLTEQTLGTNYDFRPEQNEVPHLAYWSIWAGTGSRDVCNFTIDGGNPLMVDAGPDKTIPPGGSVMLESLVNGGIAPYTYSWSPTTALTDPADPQPTASPNQTTTYTLTVSDNDVAVALDNVRVVVPTPIARWDVVPYQRIDPGEMFNCGVVAFSKFGIAKVTFVISGQGYTGPTPADVTEMTYNDRTNVYEYWTPINAIDFTSDGPIVVEATVYSLDGGIRDKNTDGGGVGLDPLTLVVNPTGSLPQPEAWVDTNGDDETGLVNDPSRPFLSVQKAIDAIRAWRNTNGYGDNADGGIVRLNQGIHVTTGSSGDIPVLNEWVTVTSADPSMLPTPTGAATTELSHVVYTRDVSGEVTIYVNGTESASGMIGGDLTNWDGSYALTLANEVTGDHPWLGEFHVAAVFDRALSQAEVSQNYAAGPIVMVAPVSPTILVHPTNQTVTEGETAVFNVLAAGTTPLSYQWQQGGSGAWEDIPGQTTATCTIIAVTMAQDGETYRCTVTNAAGNTPSDAATLTVLPLDAAISIDKTPETQTVLSGGDVIFTVIVHNTGNVELNNVIVTDVECHTLTAPSGDDGDGVLQTDEIWTYTCTVNNVTADFTNAADVEGQTPTSTMVNDRDTADVTVTLVPPRVTDGQVVLYAFVEGNGPTVYDLSGVGTPLNLTVQDQMAVSWLSEGGLAVDASTLVTSSGPATKVIEAVTTSGELTIETWIKPANTTQDGPARIVTLSADPYNRNCTLEQGLWDTLPSDVYDVRLRTTETDDDGSMLETSSGAATTQLSHVVYTRQASGAVTMYVNGTQWAGGTIGGDLSNWDGSYLLALVNETTGDRPWLGEFHLVAIFARALSPGEVEQNHAAGTAMAPIIIAHPENQTVMEGAPATFSVAALGTPLLTYQWQEWNAGTWEDILAQTGTSYTRASTSVVDNGRKFRCAVTNSKDSTTSNSAALTVTPKPTRVTDGQVVLYAFDEGVGTTVNDLSGVSAPLPITIQSEAAISWLPGGGLAVNTPTLIASSEPATKVINAITASDEFTIETWIKPANTTQNGPARILTISANPDTRNCTLDQGLGGALPADAYNTRLRTTLTAAQDGNREDTKLASEAALYNIAKVAMKGIALDRSDNTGAIVNASSEFGASMQVWIHDSHAIGVGRWTPLSNPVFYKVRTQYWTDSYISDCDYATNGEYAAATRLARGLTIEHLGNDAFRNAPMIVNCSIDDIDPGETGWHADAMQWSCGGVGDHNAIVYNVRATNLKYQGLFIRARGCGNLYDPPNSPGMAFVNVYMEMAPDAAHANAWYRRVDHLIWWHCSFAGDVLSFYADKHSGYPDWPVRVLNFSAKGNMFHKLRLGTDGSQIDWNGWDHNHYEDVEGASTITPGTNTTTGDAGLDAFGRPQPDSPLLDRINPLVVPADGEGTSRTTPADVGAYEF